MRKWYPLTLVAILLVITVIAYPRMPERVAIHFDLNGTPNGWGPRWEAVLILPFIMIFSWAMMNLVPRVDPRKESYARMQPAFALVVNAIITFLAVGQLAIIGYSLGWPVSLDRVMPALTGALFIVIGNVLPQARPNWFFGIRTPWTLSNDRVWERTHRVGGYLMVAAGVISVLSVLLPARSGVPVLVTSVVVAALGSVAYSYFAWKEEMSK